MVCRAVLGLLGAALLCWLSAQVSALSFCALPENIDLCETIQDNYMIKRGFLRTNRGVDENFLRFGRKHGSGVPSIGYRFGKRGDDDYDDMNFLRFGRAALERRRRSPEFEDEAARVKDSVEDKRNADDDMKFLRFGKAASHERQSRFRNNKA